jgi:kumamolisin
VPPALEGVVTSVGTISDVRVRPRPTPAPNTFDRAVPPLPPVPPSSQRPHTGTAEGCADGVNAGTPPDYLAFTPNQWNTAYGLSDLHAQGITGAGQRVALVEIDDFHRPDIKEWTECFGIDPPPIKHHWVGKKASTPVLGESNLDIEVLSAAAPDLESIDVYQAPNTVKSFGESLLLAVPKAFGGRKNTSDVISMSLGTCEGEQSESLAFNQAITHAFQIAAGAGISVLVASQDTGSTTCRTGKDGPGALPLLSPSFPGTNPFVTSVGGTNLELDADNRIVDQVTWNDKPNALAGSGGGTSGFYRRPWYQRGIQGNGNSGSGKGRTVPDIAGLADINPGYSILCSPSTCLGQGWRAIGGTSAATPLFAGGVALANQAAASGAKAGGSNLGFLNPLLYSIGSGKDPASLFDDITVGGNDTGVMIPPSAGGTGPTGCCKAKPGYDRATGWGSPDIAALARIAAG